MKSLSRLSVVTIGVTVGDNIWGNITSKGESVCNLLGLDIVSRTMYVSSSIEVDDGKHSFCINLKISTTTKRDIICLPSLNISTISNYSKYYLTIPYYHNPS